jgi:hypothetical protein
MLLLAALSAALQMAGAAVYEGTHDFAVSNATVYVAPATSNASPPNLDQMQNGLPGGLTLGPGNNSANFPLQWQDGAGISRLVASNSAPDGRYELWFVPGDANQLTFKVWDSGVLATNQFVDQAHAGSGGGLTNVLNAVGGGVGLVGATNQPTLNVKSLTNINGTIIFTDFGTNVDVKVNTSSSGAGALTNGSDVTRLASSGQGFVLQNNNGGALQVSATVTFPVTLTSVTYSSVQITVTGFITNNVASNTLQVVIYSNLTDNIIYQFGTTNASFGPNGLTINSGNLVISNGQLTVISNSTVTVSNSTVKLENLFLANTSNDFGVLPTVRGVAVLTNANAASGNPVKLGDTNTWTAANTFTNGIFSVQSNAFFQSGLTATGNVTATGTVTAGNLSGNGSLVTSISAANLSQGTIPTARYGGEVVETNGVTAGSGISLAYSGNGVQITATGGQVGSATNAISTVVSGNSTNNNVVTLIAGSNVSFRANAQTSTVDVVVSNLVNNGNIGQQSLAFSSGTLNSSPATLTFNGNGTFQTITVSTNGGSGSLSFGGFNNSDTFVFEAGLSQGADVQVSGFAGGQFGFLAPLSSFDKRGLIFDAGTATRNTVLGQGSNAIDPRGQIGAFIVAWSERVSIGSMTHFSYGNNPTFHEFIVAGQTNIAAGNSASSLFLQSTSTAFNSGWVGLGVDPVDKLAYLNLCSNCDGLAVLPGSGISTNDNVNGLSTTSLDHKEWATNRAFGFLSGRNGRWGNAFTNMSWGWFRDETNGQVFALLNTNNTLRLVRTNDLTTAIPLSFVTNPITTMNGTFTMGGDRGFIAITCNLTPGVATDSKALLLETSGNTTNPIDFLDIPANIGTFQATLKGVVDAGYTVCVTNPTTTTETIVGDGSLTPNRLTYY